jgi:hypothetical protein
MPLTMTTPASTNEQDHERQPRLFPAQRSDLFHDEFELGAGRVPLVVSRRLGRSEK